MPSGRNLGENEHFSLESNFCLGRTDVQPRVFTVCLSSNVGDCWEVYLTNYASRELHIQYSLDVVCGARGRIYRGESPWLVVPSSKIFYNEHDVRHQHRDLPAVLNELKNTDILQIYFRAKLVSVSQGCKEAPVRALEECNVMNKDFTEGHKRMLFADFKVVCGASSFPVHKFMLAFRSDTFAAMLMPGTEEWESGRLVLQDYTPELVRDFLKFIYTNIVDHNQTTERLLQLMTMGDKYQIDSLGDKIVELLIKSFSLGNVIAIAKAAIQFKNDRLKTKAVHFMSNNVSALQKRENLTNALSGENFKLLNELLILLAKRAKQGKAVHLDIIRTM